MVKLRNWPLYLSSAVTIVSLTAQNGGVYAMLGDSGSPGPSSSVQSPAWKNLTTSSTSSMGVGSNSSSILQSSQLMNSTTPSSSTTVQDGITSQVSSSNRQTSSLLSGTNISPHSESPHSSQYPPTQTPYSSTIVSSSFSPTNGLPSTGTSRILSTQPHQQNHSIFSSSQFSSLMDTSRPTVIMDIITSVFVQSGTTVTEQILTEGLFPLITLPLATTTFTGSQATSAVSSVSSQIVGLLPVIGKWKDSPKGLKADTLNTVSNIEKSVKGLISALGGKSSSSKECGSKRKKRGLFDFIGNAIKALTCVIHTLETVTKNIEGDIVQGIEAILGNLKTEAEDIKDEEDTDTETKTSTANPSTQASSSQGSSSEISCFSTRTAYQVTYSCIPFVLTKDGSSIPTSTCSPAVSIATTGCTVTGTTTTVSGIETPSEIPCSLENCGDSCRIGGGNPPGGSNMGITPDPTAIDCEFISTFTITALPTASWGIIDLPGDSAISLSRRSLSSDSESPDLSKRFMADIPAGTDATAYSTELISKMTAPDWLPQLGDTAGRFYPFDFGNTGKMLKGVNGLYGCTAIVIVSAKGVYLAHLFEVPVFRTPDIQIPGKFKDSSDEEFGKRAINAFKEGNPDCDQISSLVGSDQAPGPLHQSNGPVVTVITPFTSMQNRRELGITTGLRYEARVNILLDSMLRLIPGAKYRRVEEGGPIEGYTRTNPEESRGNTRPWGKVVLEVHQFHQMIQEANTQNSRPVGRWRLWSEDRPLARQSFYYPPPPAPNQQSTNQQSTNQQVTEHGRKRDVSTVNACIRHTSYNPSSRSSLPSATGSFDSLSTFQTSTISQSSSRDYSSASGLSTLFMSPGSSTIGTPSSATAISTRLISASTGSLISSLSLNSSSSVTTAISKIAITSSPPVSDLTSNRPTIATGTSKDLLTSTIASFEDTSSIGSSFNFASATSGTLPNSKDTILATSSTAFGSNTPTALESSKGSNMSGFSTKPSATSSTLATSIVHMTSPSITSSSTTSSSSMNLISTSSSKTLPPPITSCTLSSASAFTTNNQAVPATILCNCDGGRVAGIQTTIGLDKATTYTCAIDTTIIAVSTAAAPAPPPVTSCTLSSASAFTTNNQAVPSTVLCACNGGKVAGIQTTIGPDKATTYTCAIENTRIAVSTAPPPPPPPAPPAPPISSVVPPSPPPPSNPPPPPYNKGICNVHIRETTQASIMNPNKPIQAQLRITDGVGKILAEQGFSDFPWGGSVSISAQQSKLPSNLEVIFSKTPKKVSKRDRPAPLPTVPSYDGYVVSLVAGDTKWDSASKDTTKLPNCSVGKWDYGNIGDDLLSYQYGAHVNNREMDCRWAC